MNALQIHRYKYVNCFPVICTISGPCQKRKTITSQITRNVPIFQEHNALTVRAKSKPDYTHSYRVYSSNRFVPKPWSFRPGDDTDILKAVGSFISAANIS